MIEQFHVPNHQQRQQLLEQIRLFRHLSPFWQLPITAKIWDLLPILIKIRQQKPDTTCLIGISGAQGSGKTSLARLLKFLLEKHYHLVVTHISLDDFYKTKQQRQQLAKTIHPLLITRGVPGTHDIWLAMQWIRHLKYNKSSQFLQCPHFNKAIDDRTAKKHWKQIKKPIDIVLFEGWCLGARAESDQSLNCAINLLEQEYDGEGIWRQYINEQLKGSYQILFNTLDYLLFIQIPDMKYVFQWRWQQEQELKQHAITTSSIMNKQQVQWFIQHYERLTRHLLATMPTYANIVLQLDTQHRIQHLILDHIARE